MFYEGRKKERALYVLDKVESEWIRATVGYELKIRFSVFVPQLLTLYEPRPVPTFSFF